MDSIKVFAPATVANVACGFDVLGFAVEKPGDEIVIRKSNKKGVKIINITGDEGKLSYHPAENTAGVPALMFLEKIGGEIGVEISLHKKMPLGSGLGSSAASAAASAFAINELFGKPLSKNELLSFAMKGEEVACGSAHADNVAPSLFGGFTLIRSYQPLDVVKINTPSELYCTLVHPQIEVRTKDAREILKKKISLPDAIVQWGNVGGLVAGLLLSDYQLIGRSLKDVIIEPVRAILIPAFYEVKNAAAAAGALGTSISGSGPSIFSLSKGIDIAEKVGAAKLQAFHKVGIECEVYVSKVNEAGPVILD
jgi:homoserine kinase